MIANRLTYRRPIWFWLTLLQRIIVLPIAAGPWLYPQVPNTVWIWAFLMMTACNQGLIHFTTPMWLSWMGDYLPHDGLNRYWGIRQLWMQWVAALSLLLSGWMLIGTGLSIRTAFPILVAIGSVLGVLDILMFYRVEEPPVTRYPSPSILELLKGPFRNKQFRSFIRFTAFWHFAAMIGAPFISLYLLEIVGLSVGQVLLLWTFSWVGGAMSSGWLGRLAEDHGNRPVLIACTWAKSLNMLGLLVTPAVPNIAFPALIGVFMIDAVLNAGIAIANNGFLLKNSPAANRTMYIAAGTALAGMVGGLTSIVAGGFLAAVQLGYIPAVPEAATGFYLLFGGSLAMRLLAAVLVLRVREPQTGPNLPSLTAIFDATPLRILRFPVGMYRSWTAPSVKGSKANLVTSAPEKESAVCAGKSC